MDAIAEINGVINGIVWGIPMMILIVGTGIFLTYGTKFLQFVKFPYILKETLGRLFEKKESKDGAISPMQALTTALAATVGTGNIAGVAGAIAYGGPGAVFWMWLSALFGMATKFAEVTLAIHYREKNDKGEWVGGPMYYIKNGLGDGFRPLGILFSLLACLAAFGIGNMTQANTIATSVFSAIVAVSPSAVSSEATIKLVVGILVAAICGMVLLGGVKRIGAVTEKLVPIMAAIYIVACLFVILTNIGNLGSVFALIFQGAFNPTAAVGGVVGITIQEAAKRGVGRGVFSNEAGLGSAPIAHAAADTDSAVKQGFFGVFEVFADTIVICTLTAVTILISGVPITYGQGAGAELTIAAFSNSFPGEFASILVAFGLSMFAVSTMLSWGLYGTRCAEFLFGEKSTKIYQGVFVLFIVVGCTMELTLAWDIADTLNGLMAIPNLIALLLLSKTVFSLTKDHFAKLPKAS